LALLSQITIATGECLTLTQRRPPISFSLPRFLLLLIGRFRQPDNDWRKKTNSLVAEAVSFCGLA
jgi:hypothetical protein